MSKALEETAEVTVRRFKSYPGYKDTMVEWLGNIPTHWELKRLKFAVKLNPRASEVRALSAGTEVSFVPMEAVGEYGGLDLSRTKPMSAVGSGYTYFHDGDVVVAKITPCFENGKGALAAGLTNGIAFGTTELHVLRPREEMDGQFLFYLTLSNDFRRLGEAEMYGAGGQKRVPESFVENLRHPLPPIVEQRSIVDFLNRETAKIDTLVAKKERVIKLLQEKCTALITRAVTKGLDPIVPMKDSGVKWLGKIPTCWLVKKLAYVIECLDGKRIPLNAEERGRMQGEYSYWGANGIVDYIDRWLFDEELVLLGEDGAPFFEPNKIVAFHITGKAWVNNHAHVLRPRKTEVDARFLAAVLNCVEYRAFIDGSTRDKLTQGDMNRIPVQVPPIQEQRILADFLDRETAKIDSLIAKVRNGIERLKEYRTALISAAVTGKIDVREAT
jgi:type I restriction enzyme S subunit